MIKPEMLWNFIKTCEDTGKVGRVCRTLGRQQVPEVTKDELLIVSMIDNDSRWMEERIEDRKRKDRERKRLKAKQLAASKNPQIPQIPTENAESTESAPIHPSIHPSIHDKPVGLSNTPYSPPKGGESDIEGMFDEFWAVYPRKVAKQTAKKKLASVLKSVRRDKRMEFFVTMMTALRRHMESDQWTRDGGQFVPHPTTWLNQARWEDEVLVSKEAEQERLKAEADESMRRRADEARRRVIENGTVGIAKGGQS